MKVAFIRYRYDPYGGAERFTQLLMEHLAATGSEVHLFARRWKESNIPGLHLHRVGGIRWPAIAAYASFVYRVGRAVELERFDLVQSNERTLCQHIYRAGDGVHARWLELRRSQCGFFQRLSLRVNPFHMLRLNLERRLFESPKLEAVIVNSHMVREEILSRFKIRADRIHTIYNGVDLDRFHPASREGAGKELRARGGVEARTPVVLFVGSGFERKGLEPLIQALARSDSQAHLWVVGKGKTRRYEGLCRRLGLEARVKIWGPQDDVAPFYAAASFLALPTLYDPFPSVALEAMASGLPVITTRQCGAAEIIEDGLEGYILPGSGAVDLLAERIQRLCDPSRRERMGSAARRKAEGFSIDRTVGELKRLYDRLLTARSPAA